MDYPSSVIISHFISNRHSLYVSVPRGVETRPTTLEVVEVSRGAKRGRLDSRYRSTSSTTPVKLPRGCVATERMRNQVVPTREIRARNSIYLRLRHDTKKKKRIFCYVDTLEKRTNIIHCVRMIMNKNCIYDEFFIISKDSFSRQNREKYSHCLYIKRSFHLRSKFRDCENKRRYIR